MTLSFPGSFCYNSCTENGSRAGMVKLANTLVLGASASACGFESHYPHQNGSLRKQAPILMLRPAASPQVIRFAQFMTGGEAHPLLHHPIEDGTDPLS